MSAILKKIRKKSRGLLKEKDAERFASFLRNKFRAYRVELARTNGTGGGLNPTPTERPDAADEGLGAKLRNPQAQKP